MNKNDKLLAGAVLGAAFLFLLMQKAGEISSSAGMVTVWQGREQVGVYPLSEDRREVFVSPSGGRNILVIEDGEAYMEDADCPDGLCVKQGRISLAGQTLTCLPHRLQIRIEDVPGTGPDAVTG